MPFVPAPLVVWGSAIGLLSDHRFGYSPASNGFGTSALRERPQRPGVPSQPVGTAQLRKFAIADRGSSPRKSEQGSTYTLAWRLVIKHGSSRFSAADLRRRRKEGGREKAVTDGSRSNRWKRSCCSITLAATIGTIRTFRTALCRMGPPFMG